MAGGFPVVGTMALSTFGSWQAASSYALCGETGLTSGLISVRQRD